MGLPYSVVIVLFCLGIYTIIRNKNMIKIVIGFNIMESSLILLFILIAYKPGGFGYGIKIGLVPLHAWLPDAYEGSPIPYNVFSSGLVMKSAVYALIRVLYIIFGTEVLAESGILNIGVFWGLSPFLLPTH